MDYLLSDINFRAALVAGILTDISLKGLAFLLLAFFLNRFSSRPLFRGSRYWFFVLLLLFVLGAVGYYQPTTMGKNLFPWLAFRTPEPDFSFAALPVEESLSPWFLVIGAWILGAALYYVRMFWGLGHLRSLTIGGADAEGVLAGLVDESRRAARYRGNYRVLLHPDCAGPLTFILKKTPWIILPEAADTWDRDALKAALIHEFIHIRRKDFYWSLWGRILSGVFWFLPPVWFLMRQFRLSQELECDRAVVADGGVEATEYATVLLTLSRKGNGVPVLATALGTSSLELRITNLLFPGKTEKGAFLVAFLGALALGLYVLLVAAPPVAAAEPNFFKLMQNAQDLQQFDELDQDPRLAGLPLAWPVEAGHGWLENCRFEAHVGVLQYPVMQDGVRIYTDFQYRVLSSGRGKVIRILGNALSGFTVSVLHDHDVVATYSDLGKLGSIYVGKSVEPGTIIGHTGYYPGRMYGFAMSIQKEGRNIDPAAFINCGYERLIPPVYSP